MDSIRISFDVSWQFTNLDYAFSHVSKHTSRPLYVYSDVGTSNVLGDQITDFMRAMDYRREGKGSYFYEPAHLQYIPTTSQRSLRHYSDSNRRDEWRTGSFWTRCEHSHATFQT